MPFYFSKWIHKNVDLYPHHFQIAVYFNDKKVFTIVFTVMIQSLYASVTWALALSLFFSYTSPEIFIHPNQDNNAIQI